MIEGVLARGDRRIGPVIVQAWRNGAVFDGWNDLFQFDAWMNAFSQCGLDPQWDTLRQRQPDEPLPWKHMDSRIDPDFFKQEWTNALEGKQLADCRYGDCQGCGICDFSTLQPMVWEECPQLLNQTGESNSRDDETYVWLSLTYRKIGNARFFGHLELSNIFSRAIRRAQISVKYSQGFHPMPKISFDDPLPLGMESEAEYVRLLVSDRHMCQDVMTAINRHLPSGLEISGCQLKSDAIRAGLANEHHFSVYLQQMAVDEKQMALFHSRPEWPYTRKNRKGSIHRIDLKEAVTKMAFVNENTIYMAIRMGTQHMVRPTDLLSGVFNFSEEQLKGVRILKHFVVGEQMQS
jgi:radical SAM-linked protein